MCGYVCVHGHMWTCVHRHMNAWMCVCIMCIGRCVCVTVCVCVWEDLGIEVTVSMRVSLSL